MDSVDRVYPLFPILALYTYTLMSEDQKRQLESRLWNIANKLRGRISADDYRDYILGFIFYKSN